MTERQPVHWGNIGATTAESAAALLEKGNRIEMKRTPFDSIEIEEDLGAVKKEAEEVRQAHDPRCRELTLAQKIREQAIARGRADVSISWGKGQVTRKISGRTPPQDTTQGFVVLSDMKNLPWGAACERGGIYTWEQEMEWKLEEEGCYVLVFTMRK